MDYGASKRRRVPSNPESLQQQSAGKNSGRVDSERIESRSSALNSTGSQESIGGQNQAQFDGFDTVPYENPRGILNMGQASGSLSTSNNDPHTTSSLMQ